MSPEFPELSKELILEGRSSIRKPTILNFRSTPKREFISGWTRKLRTRAAAQWPRIALTTVTFP